MSTAEDKLAVVEMIVDSVTLKASAGKDACVGDTGELTATNLAAVVNFNGEDSSSTETRRKIVILVGETAPTGKYAAAAPGSLFILTGAAAGGLYVKSDATTWILLGV